MTWVTGTYGGVLQKVREFHSVCKVVTLSTLILFLYYNRSVINYLVKEEMFSFCWLVCLSVLSTRLLRKRLSTTFSVNSFNVLSLYVGKKLLLCPDLDQLQKILDLAKPNTPTKFNENWSTVFTCVSYAEAHNRYRLDVCLSVRHTLARYQNG